MRERLTRGDLDRDIFIRPRLTNELKEVIKNVPDHFICVLFVRCPNKETLVFWLNHQEAGLTLPGNILKDAVRLRGRLFLFEELQRRGHFAGGTLREREELLDEAFALPELEDSVKALLARELVTSSVRLRLGL
jgi:hypothetical protein